MKNVLFVLVDCLRADKCWGNQRAVKTSTIDSLRQKGTVFKNVIAATSTTTPNAASILTGTYPFVHGIRAHMGYKLNPSCKTLPEILKENGYTTYAEMTGPLSVEVGLTRGFDYYQWRDRKNHFYTKWGDSLVRRLRNNEFDEPWFLFVHFWVLHRPRFLLKEFNNEHFGRNRYERALSCFDAHLGKLLENVDEKDTIIIIHADHGERIAETAMTEYYDRAKETLRKICRKLGLRAPMFVVKDHGFHVFDYLVKVPLILVGENTFPKNRVIQDQVRQVDICPTLIDVLELKTSEDVQFHGRSLLPLIKGEKLEEIPAYCETVGWHALRRKFERRKVLVGIRTSRYKFAYAPYNKDIPEELYDLWNDPEEKRNIRKMQTRLAEELKQKIISIQAEKLGLETSVRRMSREEEEKMQKRLRDLGYM